MLLLLSTIILTSCTRTTVKSQYQQFSLIKNKIPESWLTDNVIILNDSVFYSIEKEHEKLAVTETRNQWYYINKRFPNDLETIDIFWAESCHKNIGGRITVYYPNGKTWRSGSFQNHQFKKIKSNSLAIRDHGKKYLEIKVPNYSEGAILHKFVKYTYGMPELLGRELLRGDYHTCKKSIRLSFPNRMAIRYGVPNGENLTIDTSQFINGGTKTFVIQSGLLNKINKKLFMKEPEKWYAGLHFSLPHETSVPMTWKALGDLYLSMISKSMTSSPEISELAGLIKSSQPDKIISEAFDLVQERVRYLADEEGIYGYVPRSASQIFKQGYGDCKEKSNLMKMILKEKGVDVNLALVMAGEGKLQLLEDYPTLGAFNHMIFYRQKPDGTINYYDPTIWFSSAEKSIYRDLGQKVFLLKKGNSRISTIVYNQSINSHIHSHSQIIKTGGKWMLKGAITLSGLAAWRSYYNLHWYKGEAFRPKVSEMLKSKFNISSAKFDVLKDGLDTLNIKFEADFDGNFLNMDEGGFLLNKPAIFRNNVLLPDDFPGPRSYTPHHQTDEWLLPNSFKNLESENFSHAFGQGIWEIKDGLIKREVIIKGIDAQPDERERALDFNNKIRRFANSTVWK